MEVWVGSGQGEECDSDCSFLLFVLFGIYVYAVDELCNVVR